MSTIKSYTDLEQSKCLAEILPIESADMYYWLAWSGSISKEKRNIPKVGTPNKDAIKTYWCPCWSLAALLEILGFSELIMDKIGEDKSTCMVSVYRAGCRYDSMYHNNPIDACYEMIIHLNEFNLL